MTLPNNALNADLLLASITSYLVDGGENDAARVVARCTIDVHESSDRWTQDGMSGAEVYIAAPRAAYDILSQSSHPTTVSFHRALEGVLRPDFYLYSFNLAIERAQPDPGWKDKIVIGAGGTQPHVTSEASADAIVARMLDKVEAFQDLLVAYATGTRYDPHEYRHRRAELLRDSAVKSLLPQFVVDCQSAQQYWVYIRDLFSSYEERRVYLYSQFEPLLLAISADPTLPIEEMVSNALKIVDWNHVQRAWVKVQGRRLSDPDGAITAARTLVETVCKHILDELQEPYSVRDDLPSLYSKTANRLRLAASQQTSDTVRRLMGGCHTIVDGMSALRNQLGDAHGTGADSPDVDPCLVELAVTLAGALATFLIRKFEAQQAEIDSSP